MNILDINSGKSPVYIYNNCDRHRSFRSCDSYDKQAEEKTFKLVWKEIPVKGQKIDIY